MGVHRTCGHDDEIPKITFFNIKPCPFFAASHFRTRFLACASSRPSRDRQSLMPARRCASKKAMRSVFRCFPQVCELHHEHARPPHVGAWCVRGSSHQTVIGAPAMPFIKAHGGAQWPVHAGNCGAPAILQNAQTLQSNNHPEKSPKHAAGGTRGSPGRGFRCPVAIWLRDHVS